MNAAFFTLLLLPGVLGAQVPEADVRRIGDGTPSTGGTLSLTTSGAPIPGRVLWAEVSGAAAGAAGALYYGTSEVDVPVAALGGSLFLAPAYLVQVFTCDAGGSAYDLGSLAPVDASLVGTDVVLQAFALDAGAQGGAALTNGVGVRFGAPATGHLYDRMGTPTGVGAGPVAIADLDGNGANELVTAPVFASGESVVVLQPDEDGRLLQVSTTPSLDRTSEIHVGDLNGDGALDLVLAYSAPSWDPLGNRFGTLLGNGDGSFQPATWTQLSGRESVGFALGDVDGDGTLDLVATEADDSDATPDHLAIFTGLGDGSFAAPSLLPLGNGLRDAALGDLDGDGVLDLTSIDRASATVDVRIGSGGGSFGPPASTALPLDPLQVELHHANGDGLLDLTILFAPSPSPPFTSQVVGQMLGAGDGTFGAPSAIGGRGGARRIHVGDLNHDGFGDLVLELDQNVANVRLVLSDGQGGRLPAVAPLFGAEAHGLALGDVDGDGRVDLATSWSIGPGPGSLLTVTHGDGSNEFHQWVELQHDGPAPAVCVGDWNGDGAVDLATSRPSTPWAGRVDFHLGDGAGGFSTSDSIVGVGTSDTLGVADVDLDGDLDVLFVEQYYGGALDPFAGVHVMLGDGAGSFTQHTTLGIPQASAGSPGPSSLELVDLDLDGLPDLVVSNRRLGFSISMGLGGGWFSARVDHLDGTSNGDRRSLTTGLVDDDAFPDVVHCAYSASQVQVYLGVGDGSLQAPIPVPVGGPPYCAALRDVDDDGVADLFVAVGSEIQVRLGNGDGTFGVPALVGPCLDARELRFADVDLDGIDDLLVAAADEFGIVFFAGRSDGSFETPLSIPTTSGALDVEVADLDRDGLPDLVAGYDTGLGGAYVFLFHRLLR